MFYIGNDEVIVRGPRNDRDTQLEPELTLWSAQRDFDATELNEMMEEAANLPGRLQLPIRYNHPDVLAHFGKKGTRVYIGPAPGVENAFMFSEHSLKALTAVRKSRASINTGRSKPDSNQLRRYCVDQNATKLHRCMAQ